MTGGLQGYQQLAQAEMMMNAGEGMKKGGGGGGLEGAGIGLGFGMAAQMMGQMNQARAPEQGGAKPNLPGAAATVTCPACNASVAAGKFCAECGKTLPPPAAAAGKFCTGCGKPMSGKFCAECGTAAPA
jgi:membrane protease subunit (stomatin/prohibitin family)